MTRRSPALTHVQTCIVTEAANCVDEPSRLRFYGDVVDRLLATCDPSTDRVVDAVNTALRRCRDDAQAPPL